MRGQTLFIPLPGQGKPEGIELTLDADLFLKLVREELASLLANPISDKAPSLKASTVKSKQSKGYASPSKPLRATGDLVNSIEVQIQNGRLEIYCNEYILYQRKELFKAFLSRSRINAAVNRAIQKYKEQHLVRER